MILTLFYLLSLNEKCQETLKEERHITSIQIDLSIIKKKKQYFVSIFEHEIHTKNVSIFNGAGLQSANNSITKEVVFYEKLRNNL